MINLSVVIPAYNESGIIMANVDELALWLNENVTVDFEILVVNDGSSDGMGQILEDGKHTREWLKVEHHQHNSGRGKAIRTGLSGSSNEYVVCMDADLSYSPEIISDLLEDLVNGNADITLASAHHPKGKMLNVPTQRALLSKWGNRMLGVGFEKNYHTVTCVVRGFNRYAIESLELVSDGKDLHLEIIQKSELLGLHIKEIPAVLEWRDRNRGRNKRSGLFPEFALFKMRKTVVSHLIFNFITSPGMLLFMPIVALASVVFASFTMLVVSFATTFGSEGVSIYTALRTTFIEGQLSLLIFLFSTVMFMIFMMFFFLSSQSKRYFDESYTLMMRMNSRIKKLEEDN